MADEETPKHPEDEVLEDAGEVADDPRGEELAASGEVDADYDVVDPEAEELTNADQTVDDTPTKGDPRDVVIDDESQLHEAEEQASAARSTRPVKRKLTQAPVKREPEKKTEATAKQSSHGTKEPGKRTGPAGFVKQSINELRKVVWPTGAQTRAYFIAVLLFVLFIMAYVGLLDAAFLWATQKLFG